MTSTATTPQPDAAAAAPVAAEPDTRPRHRRLIGPLAAIGGLAAATGFIALVDPNQPGHYPGCPTQTLAGIDCPGCGGLRATHDLAHGDIAGAFDHNALFVIQVPVIIFFLGRNVWQAWTGRPAKPLPPLVTRWVFVAFTAAILVFTIVRNLPFGSFLASG
jgi:hypothetical protein